MRESLVAVARDHDAIGEVMLAQRLERELHVARVVLGQKDVPQIHVHRWSLPIWQDRRRTLLPRLC